MDLIYITTMNQIQKPTKTRLSTDKNLKDVERLQKIVNVLSKGVVEMDKKEFLEKANDEEIIQIIGQTLDKMQITIRFYPEEN